MDPSTGQISQEQLNNIRTQIQDGSVTPEIRAFWSIQEKEIIKDRLQSKLNQLINKGLYAPNFMATESFKGNNDQYTVEFVKVAYEAIPDSEVEVTDKDIANYLNENKNKYKQERETRKLQYAILDVVPTAADSANILASITALVEEFRNTENDTLFVETQGGIFEPNYEKREELPENLAEAAFSMAIGDVYGPYEEDGTYRIAKVVDRQIVPDSARSRHILLPVNTMEQAMSAQQKLDSIKTVIANGEATFAEMAAQFSQDGSAQNGGDLNYAAQGMMVQPFNDFIFFNGKIGEPDIVFTQFGLHLVEVTDRKYITREQGVQLAIVAREISPSEDTQNDVFEKAFEIVNNNRSLEELKKAVAANNLRLQTTQALSKNEFQIGGLNPGTDSREIIRWAFGSNRKAGEVSGDVYSSSSPGVYFVEKYVIVGLSDIISEGVPPAAAMREELEGVVRNQLKAKKIMEKINGKSMDEVVAMYGANATRETADEVTFNQANLGSAGVEPKVVGAAIGLPLNTVSKPLEGNGGVFLVKTISNNPANLVDINMFKSTTASNSRRQFEVTFMQARKEKYDITDNRFKFY
jgi:peptidyl-prolyl cis-trans isomerase D